MGMGAIINESSREIQKTSERHAEVSELADEQD